MNTPRLRLRRSGLSTLENSPKPTGRVQPAVGHSRIEDSPGGAWTKLRQKRQKKFARPSMTRPLIVCGGGVVPAGMLETTKSPKSPGRDPGD